MNEQTQPKVLIDDGDVPAPVPDEGRNDAWWYRIYIAVVVFTLVVFALLWSFSYYFQSSTRL